MLTCQYDALPTQFTGKERDSESGLDDFEARYLSSSLGRFMSPDEFTGGPVDAFSGGGAPPGPLPYADIGNPQSLNKYAYTYNNPLRWTDPNGHCVLGRDTIICVVAVAGAVALTVEGIYNHFHELHAKAQDAAAAVALERVCPSSPQCNVDAVHRQTVSAIKAVGLQAAETGIAVTPTTGVPTSGKDVVIDAITDTVKDAALEAAKKKIEEKQRQEEEERKKKEQEQRKKRCGGGTGTDGRGECAIE